ncbi:hypothetical protein V8F06_008290 [Rhypophila decipiens]
MLNIGQVGYEEREMAEELEFRASIQRRSWALDRETPASEHREDYEDTQVPADSLCSEFFSVVGSFEGPRPARPEGPVTARPAAPVEPPELSCYWPEIAEAIEKRYRENLRMTPRSERGIGKLTCSICNDTDLVFDGLQDRQPWDELRLTALRQERTLLTACGHVLGMDCLETWDKTCDESNGQTKFTCPWCRFDLDPPRCSAHHLTAVTDLGIAIEQLDMGVNVNVIQPSGHSNNEDAAHCSRCQEEGQTRRDRGLDLYGHRRNPSPRNSPRLEPPKNGQGQPDPLMD